MQTPALDAALLSAASADFESNSMIGSLTGADGATLGTPVAGAAGNAAEGEGAAAAA
jgi:hypothetical protein